MALEAKITITVSNTPAMRSVLKDVAAHVYEYAPQARTHEERDASEELASALIIAVQPEQLEKDLPDA